ncbi:MAG: PPA1309 family protein, partial [Candidatus Nanopelagicales bacterium]
MSADGSTLQRLTTAVLDLEVYVSEDGWDQPIRLFALARLGDLVEREPALANAMGLDSGLAPPDELIPVEQEWSAGEEALDDALGQLAWPDQVVGVAITLERLLLPPSAEAELDDNAEMAELIEQAMGHPDRREVRLAVAVLRDGSQMCAIRLREKDSDDEVLTGRDLVPGLTEALAATFTD